MDTILYDLSMYILYIIRRIYIYIFFRREKREQSTNFEPERDSVEAPLRGICLQEGRKRKKEEPVCVSRAPASGGITRNQLGSSSEENWAAQAGDLADSITSRPELLEAW